MKKIANIPSFLILKKILGGTESLNELCKDIIVPNIRFENDDGNLYNALDQFRNSRYILTNKEISNILDFSEDVNDDDYMEIREEYLTALSCAIFDMNYVSDKNVYLSFLILNQYFNLNIEMQINREKNTIKMGLSISHYMEFPYYTDLSEEIESLTEYCESLITLFETEEYCFEENSYNELLDVVANELTSISSCLNCIDVTCKKVTEGENDNE